MKKLQVLIGGTEPVFCDVAKAAQQFWGCEVMTVPDGKQACALLRTRHVDICILDWDLPRMTGLAACHWIRSVELKTSPYIVLLTEKARPEQVRAAYLAGANDYVAKPFSMEDLHFLVSTFAQRVSRRDVPAHEPRHIDLLELYRQDLATPKIYSRL
jgi:two-component system phosphate regulon response regulator PhoB